jgi:hypothetical protein
MDFQAQLVYKFQTVFTTDMNLADDDTDTAGYHFEPQEETVRFAPPRPSSG